MEWPELVAASSLRLSLILFKPLIRANKPRESLRNPFPPPPPPVNHHPKPPPARFFKSSTSFAPKDGVVFTAVSNPPFSELLLPSGLCFHPCFHCLRPKIGEERKGKRMSSSSSSSSNAVANGVAGAGGGIIAQIITYPLQTVNTRQQTERIAKKSLSSSSSGQPPPKAAGGTLLQIIHVIRTEGWGGLYSGLKPSLLGTAASQGIYYYFYQVFKNKAEAIATARNRRGYGDGTVGVFSWLVVAALAGSLNVLLTIPIWVLVTRMQTQTQAERKIMEEKMKAALLIQETSSGSQQHKLVGLDSIKARPYGTIDAAREVYNESGIRGFWKGVIPTLIMVCNPSIQFMIYESSLKRLKAKRETNKLGVKNVSAWEVFLLGALAKLGATVTTYPLLVVKSRLQAKQEIGGNMSQRYSGTIDAIIKMIQYEGLWCFYKGMSTKIVQSVFAASLLFMIKEELVKAYMLLASKTHKFLLNLKTN